MIEIVLIKNLPANAGDTGSIPDLECSSGVRNNNLIQYSCLENPMDRGALWATYSLLGHKDLDMTE